jgi:cytochrome c-type biogenesis protein CcmH/NrfF
VRRLLPLAAVAALVVIAAATGLSAARGPDPNVVPTAQEVDARTMSPFCVGQTLASCTSSEATRLRTTIAGMVQAGKTNREIDAYLVASYPKAVIGAPRSLVAWGVPAAAVLAALSVMTASALRRPRAAERDEADVAVAPLPAADSARLDAELRRFAQENSE